MSSRPGTGSRFGTGIFAVVGPAVASKSKDPYQPRLIRRGGQDDPKEELNLAFTGRRIRPLA